MNKPLIETNPYLKDEETREKLVSRSVRTSCGVEGIKAPRRVSTIVLPKRKEKRIYKMIKQ